MKKKLLRLFIFILTIFMTFSLIGCDFFQTKDPTEQIEKIYAQYVAYAQEKGVTPLTYEEWLASIKGEPGTNGADGKSAYQIWLDEGYTGTESDFLEWLKGKDGYNGKDGKDVFEVWYQALKDEGYTGNYADFLEEYIKGNVGDDEDLDINNANTTLLSSVEVYAVSSKKGDEKVFSGGGTVIRDDKENGTAYIVTNFHVIYDPNTADNLSKECYVMFYGMAFLNGTSTSSLDALRDNAVKCEVIGGSLLNDIAVLKIENSQLYKNGPYKAATIANSEDVVVGDNAIVVGNPESEGFSITKGVISVDSEEIDLKGADDVTDVSLRVIRTDADLNHGNSGGGLFNSKGEFIGVISIKNFSSDIDGFGYAIPSNVAIGIANNIITRSEDKESIYDDAVASEGYGFMKCVLGVQVVVKSSWAEYDSIEGVVRIKQKIYVDEVLEGAAKNYLFENDELVSASLNGKEVEVNRLFSIGDLLLNAKKGDTLTIKLIRVINEIPTEVVVNIPLVNSSYVQ